MKSLLLLTILPLALPLYMLAALIEHLLGGHVGRPESFGRK